MRTRYFFIVLFGIGLFASYYGNQLTGQSTATAPVQEVAILEVYLVQSSSSQLDKDGHLKATLASTRSEKFTLNSHTLLKQPNVGFYTDNKTWQLTADSAIFDEQANLITLQNNVILKSQDGQAQLTTTELSINNKLYTAFTDAAVNIQLNGSNTDATGIRINMDDEIMSFPANVKTRFQPSRK